MVVDKPYTEKTINKTLVREFDSDVDVDELVWHRDKKDRYITVKESGNWQLQMDDELPIDLVEGEVYFIPKNHYHRVIKGDTTLVVEIDEMCGCKSCGCDKMKL